MRWLLIVLANINFIELFEFCNYKFQKNFLEYELF